LLVLAAGLSTRFGRNKLLERVNSVPLIRLVVAMALASRVDDVVVVLGHQAARVRAALSGLACRVVLNRDYRAGQSGSIKAGLKGLSHAVDAVLVLPGDSALIRPADINAVLDAYVRSRARIVVAAFRGRHGHPILIDRRLFSRLRRISERSHGLKAVVTQHADDIRAVEVPSERVLIDVDTPTDFARYLAKRRR
jgi:molybdenum cofactor cytidylyltransferase